VRIDSHVLFSAAHPPEHLAAILARNRFGGAILFAEAPIDLPHILGFVPPLEHLDAWRDHPTLCGVSISLERDTDLSPFLDPRLPVGVRMCPRDFPRLVATAIRYPTIRFAIDHLGRPPFAAGITPEWRRGMESAAGQPNVYCKISGLLAGITVNRRAALLRPFVEHALSVFGPARLMFASEWPAGLPGTTWKETLAAFTQAVGVQPVEARDQILGLTAQRFFNFGSAAG
jgi:hypothetical protein